MALHDHTDKIKTVLLCYNMYKVKLQLGKSPKHNTCYYDVT